MYSCLDTSILYADVSPDITENDINIVSDLWTIDDREVYRGSRDPRYSHANVYWLYNEDLQRVGCCEHSITDHAKFEVLWFRESEFGTMLQEDWEVTSDIWSTLPNHVFERFINNGWTTPHKFLEQCLSGSMRIITPDMIINQPIVYSCGECKQKSLRPICPSNQMSPLDFPDKTKIVFVDDDLVIHIPPTDSTIWSRLMPPLPEHDDDLSLLVLEQVEESPNALQEQKSLHLPLAPPQTHQHLQTD